MICFPNCKINIGLYVINKREDGYHNIETLFYPVPLCDMLEINVMPGQENEICEFRITGSLKDNSVSDNLVYKAHRLLSTQFRFPAVGIHLHKIIPAGAGLGGGSSDAAFTLKVLNDMFSLGLNQRELINFASQLGSDCAFFIKNKTVLAFERGNKFHEAPLIPVDMFVVIVHPGIHVNTGPAYAGITPDSGRPALSNLVRMPVEKWKDFLVNDFESVIFEKHPAIAEIKRKLYDNGAFYASMSGSGSSVYGLFNSPPGIRDVFPGYFYWEEQLS